MPNWVSNSIQSPNTGALLHLRDFNSIVPQPLVTESISGSLPDRALRLFQQGKGWRDLLEDTVFLDHFDPGKPHLSFEPRYTAAQVARRYWLGYCLHGHPARSEWCREHWGTSCAIDYCLGPGSVEVRFKTAWSHPFPLIKALSRQFPDDVFVVNYADEDLGYNAGEYEIRNGIFQLDDDIENASREAFEIAFRHWGHAEDYELVDGTYRYRGKADDGGATGDGIEAPSSVA